jgi:hemolysin activation/secretion protein
MRKLVFRVIVGVALTPVGAIAQSQVSGTQELISELQHRKVDRPSADVKLETTVERPTVSAAIDEFQIGSILVSGSDGTAMPEYGATIEPFIGSVVGQPGLQDVATALASEARNRGYSFASAYIPEQKIVLGSVRVIVDLGRIDEVEIEGSDNPRLARMLSELEGRFARKSEIERKLLLARDIPGVVINSTEYLRENGRGRLLVRAAAQRSSGSAVLDNYGDKAAGPVRARLDVDYSGIVSNDDRLSVGVTATPIEPGELTFVAARYANLIGIDGSQIWLTAAAGRTNENQPGGDWRSRNRYVALAYNTPILRSDSANLWLTVEAAFLDVDQSAGLGTNLEDHVTTLSVSASGNVKLVGGRLSGGVTYVRGLDLFGSTGPQDPQSSRFDGSGSFSKEQVWLNWYGLLGKGFSMRIAGNGQVASRPLLASQEIGLGGVGYGRAYSFYERSGDEGAMGLFELRHATDNPVKYVDWLQFYGFVDGGYVSNRDGGIGSGGLASSGAGIRSGIGRAELGLEVAVPVDDVRFETGDRSPRFNVSVGYRF